MKFLLTCMVALLLASIVELARQGKRQPVNPKAEFEKAGISCITAPPNALQFVFNINITVNFGNTIPPPYTTNITSVGYYGSPDCMYTLMILDMDAPYTCDPYMSPWLAGMYCNIRSSDISSADMAVAYIPPTPPVDSGIHRIVIMLYLQVSLIDINSECFSQYELYRMGFPLEDFMSEYGLTPVAGNYYKVSYPKQMKEVCGEYCEEYCGTTL